MAGCGYVCPKCEGKGLDDDFFECDWCKIENQKNIQEITDKEWIENVHNQNCCSDIGSQD